MQRGREPGTHGNKGALTRGRNAKNVIHTVEMHMQIVSMPMFEEEMVLKWFLELIMMYQYRKSKSILNSKHISFSKSTPRANTDKKVNAVP